MSNLLGNLAIEMAFFTFLGILYYFYQRRRILQYEENKTPLVMGLILQSCLSERGDSPQHELDALIESIDDYLQNRIATPPLVQLKHYAASAKCSPELKAVIDEGIAELN
jgi:hypothetical protein